MRMLEGAGSTQLVTQALLMRTQVLMRNQSAPPFLGYPWSLQMAADRPRILM